MNKAYDKSRSIVRQRHRLCDTWDGLEGFGLDSMERGRGRIVWSEGGVG